MLFSGAQAHFGSALIAVCERVCQNALAVPEVCVQSFTTRVHSVALRDFQSLHSSVWLIRKGVGDGAGIFPCPGDSILCNFRED